MTAVDLDAIRRREQAATRGPWAAGQDGLAPHEVHLSAFLPVLELSGGLQGEANAEFIAHARTDVPAMADGIEQLRARLAAVERYADELRADARTETDDALAVGLLRAADGLGDLLAGAVAE